MNCIKCSDRLPEKVGLYDIWIKETGGINRVVDVTYSTKDELFCYNGVPIDKKKVTHWAPSPEPPKEEE